MQVKQNNQLIGFCNYNHSESLRDLLIIKQNLFKLNAVCLLKLNQTKNYRLTSYFQIINYPINFFIKKKLYFKKYYSLNTNFFYQLLIEFATLESYKLFVNKNKSVNSQILKFIENFEQSNIDSISNKRFLFNFFIYLTNLNLNSKAKQHFDILKVNKLISFKNNYKLNLANGHANKLFNTCLINNSEVKIAQEQLNTGLIFLLKQNFNQPFSIHLINKYTARLNLSKKIKRNFKLVNYKQQRLNLLLLKLNNFKKIEFIENYKLHSKFNLYKNNIQLNQTATLNNFKNLNNISLRF